MRPLLKLSAASLAAIAAVPASAQSLDELREMSIDDLANVNVTSVSKTDQPLSEAPAAIYVITREDIVRSGAVTIPEMLRLAPNLQVYQTAPGQWVVTARGLNGNLEAQSFPNKLLVLIDGRPIYTPIFSGVFWDLPDVLPDNVDRIEVISGPGATLWGANAMNGVINIITRRTSEVSGVYADARAGPDKQAVGLRVAGRAGENLDFSVHGRFLRDEQYFTPAGADAGDGRRRIGGGFRFDWTPGEADLVTLHGEVFDNRIDQPAGTESTAGRNVTLRWTRRTDSGGEIQGQLFYDRISRDDRAGGGIEHQAQTFDAELQHSFKAGERHQIVLGGGARLFDYQTQGTASLFFDPAGRELFIANLFVQDSYAVTPELTVTGGLKIEHLPYVGTSLLPEARIAWKPAPAALLWASVARAVRAPTPFDVDVEERVGGLISISGDPEFRTAKLTAFELGTRLQPAADFSLSANLFYNLYDDLRSVEFVPGGPAVLPLGWGNGLEGETYGVDLWADWRVTSWWTLTGGATLLERDLDFKPGSSGILGTAQAGTDPPYWITLRSSMNLGAAVTVDLDVRAVGALRDAAVPAYRELGGRLAWRATPDITLSLAGSNLLHDRHLEYPRGDLIPRRILAGAELAF